MSELTPEIDSLLREMRSYLANSNDPWEQRRELILKINNLASGGEVDLFVATIREMGRIGTSYAAMMQTFNQLYATQQAGASMADFFARSFGASPGIPQNPFINPAALDLFKQMGDFFTTQTKTFTEPPKAPKTPRGNEKK
ncbi:MAG: hypothetical protein HYU77_08020 [Betaproteobacteria bacterium]|nr:hypothetical protein [Betaproteobacteria bacterium]